MQGLTPFTLGCITHANEDLIKEFRINRFLALFWEQEERTLRRDKGTLTIIPSLFLA